MMINDKLFSGADDKLENALMLLATGLSLPEVLAEAGEDADWLAPLLEMTAEIGELPQAIPLPPPGPSLQRMLGYSKELDTSTTVSGPVGLQAGLARLLGGLMPRLAGVLVAILLVIILLGSIGTMLAQQSLPGQPLYSLKRAGETLRLTVTLNSQERERLQDNFNQRRQQEVQLLLEQNRVATVAFEGHIEATTATSLTVAGLATQLTSQTDIRGNLTVGARIRLEVLTQPPDQLIVLAVTVLEPTPSTPTSTLTPPPQATATPGMSQATDTLILSTSTPTPVLSRATDVLTLPAATPVQTSTPLPPSPAASPTLDSIEPGPTAAPLPDGGNTNDNVSDNMDGDGDGNDVEDNANDNESADDTNNGNSGSDGGDDNSGRSGGDDNSSSDGGDDNSGRSGGDDNSGSGGGGKDDRDDDKDDD